MSEQYPYPIGPEREEDLIRRIQGDTGETAEPQPEQLPMSRDVAEEVVVRDVIARQVSLKDRIHADPNEPKPPKRPSLRDRIAAERVINPEE